MTELTDNQKTLIDKHYNDALKIGASFKSSILHDDEKENIAIMNLIRAVRTYDATRKGFSGRPVSFTTWLYTCIWTSLLNADKGVFDKSTGEYRPLKHKLPRTKLINESIFSRIQENWKDDSVSEFASLFPKYEQIDELEFAETLKAIKDRLDERQWFLFKALIDPVGMNIPITSYKKASRVTVKSLASISGVTKQRVSQEIKKIKAVVKYVIDNQDSPYFRVAPKERDNG